MVRTWYVVLSVCLMCVTVAAAADDEKKSSSDDNKAAQAGKRDGARFFDQFDKNKDGFIDRSEAPDRLKERFDQLDKNGDGKLSREELARVLGRFGATPAPATGGDALFKLLDTDGDGKLSREELQNAPKLLEKLDKNKDGVLDRDELAPPAPARRRTRPTTAATAETAVFSARIGFIR